MDNQQKLILKIKTMKKSKIFNDKYELIGLIIDTENPLNSEVKISNLENILLSESPTGKISVFSNLTINTEPNSISYQRFIVLY